MLTLVVLLAVAGVALGIWGALRLDQLTGDATPTPGCGCGGRDCRGRAPMARRG